MQTAQPLSGKLVLDLSQGIAGPYAARLLAEHGARVIKVEPPVGDWVRKIGGGPKETSVNFLYYNLGKETISLDLKTPEGLAAARAIAAKADVMVESARPGATERLGLGFNAVREINPSIVYLSVSGFGQTGPRGQDPMTDTVAQAYSGMMSVNHGMDGAPHKLGATVVDSITGLYGFQAVTMALWHGGPAQHLDVSLMQSAAAIMGPKAMEFAHFGEMPASINPPAGSYRTADGWIAITLVRESHFVALCNMVGVPELAENPAYATFPDRLENLPALLAILKPLFLTRPTAEWEAMAAEMDVLASAVNTFGDWMADPQVVATTGAPMTEVLAGGVMAPVVRTPGRVPFDRPAPDLDADTARVMSEFLPAGAQ